MRAETLAKTASTRGVRVALVAALVAACIISAMPAWGAITRVDVAGKADRAVITVSGDSALRMTPIVSTRGTYLGFQFPSHLAAKGRIVGIHSGGIYNVRISNFRPNPPTTRIVVNTTGRHDYATNWSEDRRRVEISVMKTGRHLPKPDVNVVKVKAMTQEVKGPGWTEETPAPATVESADLPDLMPAPELTAFGPKVEAAPVVVASAADVQPVAEPTPVVEVKPVVATPVVEVKPVVEAKPVVAVPRVDPKPVVAAWKVEPKPLVRIASADPTMMARYIPAASESKPSWPERNINLNFLGADINDVLKALAVQSGHNIVSSKDVKGNITVSLNRVSIDEAMEYVAKLSGYSYTNDNGTYLVASKEALGSLSGSSGAGPSFQVASVAYANPDDVMQLVKSQFPSLQVAKISKAASDPGESGNGSGKAQAVSSNTRLVFTGDAGTIDTAKQMIAQVDESMKTQLASQKTEVYRVNYVKPQDLAKTLAALVPGISVYAAPQEGFDLPAPSAITLSNAGATVSTSTSTGEANGGAAPSAGSPAANDAGASSQIFDPKSKSRTIIIVGRDEDVARALTLAASVDVRSPQIKIDAKITSLTASGEKKLGLSWDWDKISFTETGMNAWKRDAVGFSATLEALITSGDGQLLASPSLVCLDGKPGVFFVGDEVTYIQRIEVTATGQNITTDTKQVGVQLRVNGTANLDGYITLNLHPEVSVLKLSTQQGITLPVVTRRFTDHVVRVKSGQTIVIGGLIRNEDIEEMRKVPLLGDLPLLGNLFRHKSKTTDHTEVVMFITATVLAD